MNSEIIKGQLCKKEGKSFIDCPGVRFFEDRLIWEGYLTHWLEQNVCVRELPQLDYETGQPIIIMWPEESPPDEPIVDFYYNERLVKYPASLFGHNAININGNIYNFSHLMNENEIMKPEEYFYRPALGEFAPSPINGKFEILDDGRAYYDKFGRNFMRSIHVLRIRGMETERLSSIFNEELDIIHNTPVNPEKPEKYADFSFFTRSCSTIIRDGLIKYGFKNINGILPRDLFVSTVYNVHQQRQNLGVDLELYTMPQLKVPEAPYSVLTPLMNIKHRKQHKKLIAAGLI
ncbi:MAG: hypothetical protein H8E70_08490 [Candidatus Marinimicrobia bacterium]|nr:hypothetical protein [Candidatus Neomarinimicrobiota bacterium]